MNFDDSGFDELVKQLQGYIEKAENPTDILEVGALELVDDVSKLPKPMSEISKAGYTHLLDSVGARLSTKYENEVEVGWGKRYGNVLEHGSYKMDAQKHLYPTFTKNKNKYYNKMLEKFHGG